MLLANTNDMVMQGLCAKAVFFSERCKSIMLLLSVIICDKSDFEKRSILYKKSHLLLKYYGKRFVVPSEDQIIACSETLVPCLISQVKKNKIDLLLVDKSIDLQSVISEFSCDVMFLESDRAELVQL